MIKVYKDYKKIPDSLNYSEHKTRIRNLLIDKNQHSMQGYENEDVKILLHTIYNSKCAYCESKQRNAVLNIEHYRPKGNVKDIDNNLITNHLGYYWLTYEWSNLLLSCPDCNSQKNKGNKFPLVDEAKRIFNPDANKSNWNSNAMKTEKPLLLNPEIDNPNEHIEIQFDGTLKGLTEFGIATIEICKLNRKAQKNYEAPLAELRKEIIDDIIKNIKEQANKSLNYLKIEDFKKEKIFEDFFFNIFSKIKENQKTNYEFSFLYQMIYKKFDKLIDYSNELKPFKKLILSAFEYFKITSAFKII